ncbi:hypothetical protein V1227_08835 [Lentzea sp. DG1S-22]|uniref:hypothetical protein n=1 Tax=Lentzea sp. DG1S-22 TaxID=3108822 RepID=UPI002E770392|nr:hypothetical protein [Lentzea sp. DG1S-22]WVH82837.1 hypothetical protein V1227_08835 [Lentzea sp. DG1S-22]
MTAPGDEPVGLIAQELDAEYVGVGRRGTLYRAPGRRRFYRLIPGVELGAEHRDELKRRQHEGPRAGLAAVVPADTAGDQQRLGGRWYQVVCYETDARRSLADAIADPDPARRVEAVVAALRALPGWWESLGPGMVPMPADIVLTDSGPRLLPLPCWGAPSFTELLSAPERVLHLAPGLARGQTAVGREEDVFALAAAALRCFGTSPDTDAARLLHRTACAVAPSGERLHGRLPVWMRRVGPIRAVLEDLCELTTAPRRGGTDITWLADRLQRARNAMDPVAAVQALRAAGEPDQALSLAQAVLVDGPHYDVLVLAATIAYQDTAAPLEALTLLDRAVEADPKRVEAYEEQMSVVAIGEVWATVQTLLSDAIDDSFTRRLDATVQTAFHRLPHELRAKHAPAMASHLIREGRVREANAFAHKWLHDGKTLMWWRFDLMIAYATTFWLLGKRAEAAQVGDVIRQGLKRVRDNGSLEITAIELYELLLDQLEEEEGNP